MFLTTRVHHQEDHLYMQFLWYIFHDESNPYPANVENMVSS